MTVRNDQSGSPAAVSAPRWSAHQLEALDEAIGRAADTLPTVLLVEGGPGTGKTTFLRRVAVAAQGFHVLQLQADSEWQQPYAALVDWGVLDAPADPALTSLQAARMLRTWIEKIRSGAPVLIVLDDVQSLDTESSDMIARLVERTFSDRLLVVAAADTFTLAALAPWSRLALDADRAIHLELTGLDEPAAAELVTTRWPGAEAALCTRLWEHTTGNPLFLQTILHEHTLDEVRDADELPAPRDLARTITARLDADEASLLRAAVILGDRRTPSPTAGALAGLEDPADALDRLRLQGLLVVDGGADRPEVRVASGVLRAAIADTIPSADRRALHRRAAELVDSPIDALRHRHLAANGYDDDLAAELDAAAWSLHVARRFQQASRVGRRAADVTADPAVRERRFLDALFDALMGRDFDSVERRLARVGYAHDEARRTLVEGFLLVGRRRWSRASAVLLSIPAALIEATDERTRLRLHILRAWIQTVTGGSVEGARHELALANAQPAVEPCLSGYFGFASAQVAGAGVTGAPARVTDGLDLDDAWRGAAAAIAGLPDVAVRNLAPFTARIDDGLVTVGDGEFHALLGYAYWLRGDWPEARERIRTSLESRYGAVNPMVRAVAVLADLTTGNPGTLTEHRAQARAALREAPWPQAITMALTAEFVCLRLTGRHAEQARYLDDLNTDFGTLTWPVMESPLWLLTLGMINAAARRPEPVREFAARLGNAPAPVGWREAGVAWLHGLAAESGGDLQEAARRLDEARARGMGELRVHGALLTSDLARVRRSLGDDTGAASAQHESDDRLAQVEGARYLIAPATDPLAPLSDREREVVALLTQGLSYAQIARELYVSRSTVGFHLSNIYAKTATTSRHELTALVRG
ncbi:LuxR C-terminal-related transcriptional regulator [Nocardia alni]|uniref:LuxR C-terminal-related transcriptional regulator n=1 Tax=Nocardia alni TaxID=2815723 RepID=UPI001C222369|nr:LuxR C-terminal-related transcriptional regulator [Nocardia alni]